MNFRALVIILASLSPFACGETIEQTATHTFYGTLESTSVDASGHRAYLRLVDQDGELGSEAYYLTDCMLQGPACDFQINFVVEAEYKVFGVIDMNNNAAMDDPLPDAGDLTTPGRPLLLYGKTRMDFPDEAWHLTP